MELKEVRANLCYHDKRNPGYDDYNWPEEGPAPPPRAKRCMCDNCFYGRDKLAVALIDLLT